MSRVRRRTSETNISVQCQRAADSPADEADRTGSISTGNAFLDHMLVTLGRYAGLRLVVDAAGDLHHHLLEDVAITLGLALRDEIPERCARYGHAVVPMDEALVEVVLDAGGRAYYCGPLPSSLYDHVMRSLAMSAGLTLHIRVLRGTDRHHIVEAAFKALGLAVRQAMEPGHAVFSTKGAIVVEREEEDPCCANGS